MVTFFPAHPLIPLFALCFAMHILGMFYTAKLNPITAKECFALLPSVMLTLTTTVKIECSKQT